MKDDADLMVTWPSAAGLQTSMYTFTHKRRRGRRRWCAIVAATGLICIGSSCYLTYHYITSQHVVRRGSKLVPHRPHTPPPPFNLTAMPLHSLARAAVDLFMQRENGSIGRDGVRVRTGDEASSDLSRCPLEPVMVYGEGVQHGAESGSAYLRPIPLIGTNVDYDQLGMLTRLIDSIYTDENQQHVSRTLIAAGGCQESVMTQLRDVRHHDRQVSVFHHPKHMGCAPGWSVLLSYMAYHRDTIPWAVIVNSDIYVPQGSLAALSREIWSEYDNDPLMCVGLIRQQFKQGTYSAFVYTTRALDVLGIPDENIWPAYYEDNDLQLRQMRAVDAGLCSPRKLFQAAALVHGVDKEYVSGIITNLQALKAANSTHNTELAERIWAQQKRGMFASKLYLKSKWGCPFSALEPFIPRRCKYMFPFNDVRKGYGHWVLDRDRRAFIETGEGELDLHDCIGCYSI